MKHHLPILVTLLVLCWLAVDRMLRPPAELAEEYHERVRAAAADLPHHFGPWLATDVPVPAGAVKLLRPNVLLSRQYRNIQTDESVVFAFIQVRDARDTIGHYPPACYPSQGWTTRSATPATWTGPSGPVDGSIYHFVRGEFVETNLLVHHFLLLPDGGSRRDTSAIESVAQDRLRKLFGAAQVQLIFDVSLDEGRRNQITEEFLIYSRSLIEVTGSGDRYVTQ